MEKKVQTAGKEALMAEEWKQKCDQLWQLGAKGVPAPDGVDWKAVYEKKPLERNLLRNPAPHGLSHSTPPPEREVTGIPPDPNLPPQFEPRGDFSGWSTNTEVLPIDSSGIPPGVVVCYMPQFRWFSMEQRIDLKAEGLWDELLDQFQPDIVVEDCSNNKMIQTEALTENRVSVKLKSRIKFKYNVSISSYEESQLHASIYELDVKLLAADGKTVIKEHTCSPTEQLANYSHTWKRVSHVFSGYGPGVRHVSFRHKLKNKFMVEFFGTLVTDSSVVVKASRSTP
ncbi:hypothetical protein NFI96_021201 [Prochilodus magdalenae]|nr:hypothetical protein NFI96_021201 [Prochilodus magdalenae]